MHVVNLGECRDLLRAWDAVRAQIIRGNVKGYALTIKGWDGQDHIYFAGLYREQGESAASAALRLSWELTKEEDLVDLQKTAT